VRKSPSQPLSPHKYQTMSPNPMTKLWYITLKPPTTTISSPRFRQLWAEVLDFVSSASGPVCSGHTLWQDPATNPRVLVMLSGYPSYESNQATDKVFMENGFMKRMVEFVDHGRLLQIEMDVNALPLDAEVLCIETYSSTPSDAEGKGMIEGVELGKDVARQKLWLSVRGLRDEDAKQIADDRTGLFQRVYLKRIMG
jgi:hypothetical protein